MYCFCVVHTWYRSSLAPFTMWLASHPCQISSETETTFRGTPPTQFKSRVTPQNHSCTKCRVVLVISSSRRIRFLGYCRRHSNENPGHLHIGRQGCTRIYEHALHRTPPRHGATKLQTSIPNIRQHLPRATATHHLQLDS